MNLYLVQFDGERYYVEAPSIALAVKAWKDDWRTNGEDYDEEEPESVALVNDKAVIRESSRQGSQGERMSKDMAETYGICAVCAADIDEPGWICCGLTFCGEPHMEAHQASDEHEEPTP